MRNRAATGRLGVAIWIVVAVLGDIALALAPIPPGQAATLASDESEVIRILAMAGWPIFFGVLMGLYFMLFLNRVAPSEREVPPGELRGNSRLQTTWIVTSVVLVLILATYGTVELANEEPGAGVPTSATALSLPTSPSQPLEVQVIAQQWWFTYRYPAYGGIETAQLVLPVGQKIEFNVTSLDVVHSFNFFALGVKADAVPLNDNVVSSTSTEIGTYRVQCTELCGLWHGNMSDNTAMVVSQSDFASWIQQQTALDAPIMKYLLPYSHTYEPSPVVYGH